VPEAHDTRLRIEHAQVVRKEDVRRFAELGVIASMRGKSGVSSRGKSGVGSYGQE
jgi:predicted amidohydrolase YtcJ